LSNAERLVLHRQRALDREKEPNAQLTDVRDDVRELAQLLAGSRELLVDERRESTNLLDRREVMDDLSDQSLFDELSDVASIASDVSEHLESNTVKTVRTTTVHKPDDYSIIDITVEVSPSIDVAPLPARKYVRQHEASDINFSQLPPEMQKKGFLEALLDFYKGECWEKGGDLSEWKSLRRKHQNLQARGGEAPTVVILDATWVTKATVDESVPADRLHPQLGALRAKVRLAPRGFREKGTHLDKSQLGAPTVSAVTMKLAETFWFIPKKTTRTRMLQNRF
jgi:hypothetical protein